MDPENISLGTVISAAAVEPVFTSGLLGARIDLASELYAIDPKRAIAEARLGEIERRILRLEDRQQQIVNALLPDYFAWPADA